MRTVSAFLALLFGLLTISVAHAGASLAPFAAPSQLRSYKGEVATRATFPSLLSTGTYMMARSKHIMRENTPTISICLPNFYLKSASLSGTGETGTGAAATVTLAVEYAGAEYRLPFSGAVTGTIANGGYICSDDTPNPVPYGSVFYVREYGNFPSGFPYTTYINSVDGNTDTLTFSSSPITDQTMGGTVAQTVTGPAVYPMAILGTTTRPSVCLIGDSRTLGYADALNDATSDNGDFARYIGPRYAYIKMASSGDRIQETLTNFAIRAYFGQTFCTVVVDADGINDLFDTNRSAATVAGYRATLANYFPNQKVFGATLYGEDLSTDNFATAQNQTTKNAPAEAIRLTFNNLVRAGIAGENNYIDIAQAFDPGDTGLFLANGTANATTPEGTHGTSLTSQLIRDAPIWGKVSFER